MEKIKKNINECNQKVVKQLSNLYNDLSNSLDQSYYYGQISAYDEMLEWVKNFQNKSMKFIPPENIKYFFKVKGATQKNDKMICEENSKKKISKANFNYLYYDQTFKNNLNENKNEQNLFPTSVENAINNNKIHKSISSFNFIHNNDIKSCEETFRLSLLTNPSLNNLNSINNNCINNNNNMEDDSSDEQIKPYNLLKYNITPNMNIKKRKNQ